MAWLGGNFIQSLVIKKKSGITFNLPHEYINFSKATHCLTYQHNAYARVDIRPRQYFKKESWMLVPKPVLNHLQTSDHFETEKYLTMDFTENRAMAFTRARFEQVVK